MSGFLRRLARRTLHPTPAVHSQARLPYAPPPAWDAAAPPLESVGEIPTAMDPAMTATLPTVTDSMSPAATAADPLPLRQAAESGRFHSLSPSSVATNPAPPERQPSHSNAVSVEGVRRIFAEPADRPPASRFFSRTQGPEPDRYANPELLTVTGQADSRAFMPLIADPIPGHEPGPGRDGFDAPAATASLSSPVENRVLATRSSGHSPLPTRTAQRAPAGLEPVDETPTVHVTIGRIEITAVHAPPQPKPKSAPARQPMSLDDYLARRNRGRP